MMVPHVEGRRLKVEKGVGSIKACGATTLEEVHQIYVRLAQRMDPSAVEGPSMEGRGVRSTEAKEPPSELCYRDSSSSVWYGYLYMCLSNTNYDEKKRLSLGSNNKAVL
ncbi:hypothetical protein RHMOL_Rhmol03G0257700 [Rhododendron molle]|uniref:Uncharacterized protein n=1 Tax=Rhododendron molle TaxID=49168 RepID=A0ACC0PJY5_RHOML|nr:hypothetical protein RHMOL_Rhmol03G0257700 [Rhododendron molle]